VLRWAWRGAWGDQKASFIDPFDIALNSFSMPFTVAVSPNTAFSLQGSQRLGLFLQRKFISKRK
jgi:hypothetical protein